VEDAEPAQKRGGKGGNGKERKMPRTERDKKFGRPQESRRPKQNDKKSTNDLFSRPVRTNKGSSKKGRSTAKGKATSGKARPGKSKRQKS
jgi:rRNA-processing protein EBP2